MTEETAINITESENTTPTSTEKTRTLSEAQLVARRANAKKSTGPRTLAGRIRSSQNARKDGSHRGHSTAYSRSLYDRMEDLGEDPAEFAEIEDGLRTSFLPSNKAQEMVLHQIALLEWERQRLERAQAALLARRIQKLEIERERESLTVSQKITSKIPTAQLTIGLVWHRDESPTKYQKLLEWLEMLQGCIEFKDYETAEAVVGWIYGKVPTVRGAHIKSSFRVLAKAGPKAPPDESAISTLRMELLREISDVTAQYNLYLREHVDLTPTMRDERLAPNHKQRDLMAQMNMIDRRIDQKIRLLLTLQKFEADRDRDSAPGRRSEEEGPQAEDREGAKKYQVKSVST
jgi:hypothetical protein